MRVAHPGRRRTGAPRPLTSANEREDAMTEFVGLRTRLKPGMAQAYKEAHDAIWPEILEGQRAAGIKRYLIFRDGLDLFHAIEVDDFDAAAAMLGQHPVDQRWQAEMARFVATAEDVDRPGATRLELVYNRSPAGGAWSSLPSK